MNGTMSLEWLQTFDMASIIKVRDSSMSTVSLQPNNNIVDVSASPSSVSVLAGMEEDVRTPDKLFDDVTCGSDGRHAWLAPVLPGQVTRA